MLYEQIEENIKLKSKNKSLQSSIENQENKGSIK